jgi:hypothetical protein
MRADRGHMLAILAIFGLTFAPAHAATSTLKGAIQQFLVTPRKQRKARPGLSQQNPPDGGPRVKNLKILSNLRLALSTPIELMEY